MRLLLLSVGLKPEEENQQLGSWLECLLCHLPAVIGITWSIFKSQLCFLAGCTKVVILSPNDCDISESPERIHAIRIVELHLYFFWLRNIQIQTNKNVCVFLLSSQMTLLSLASVHFQTCQLRATKLVILLLNFLLRNLRITSITLSILRWNRMIEGMILFTCFFSSGP